MKIPEPKFKIGDLIFVISGNSALIERVYSIHYNAYDGFCYEGFWESRLMTKTLKFEKLYRKEVERSYKVWFGK